MINNFTADFFPPAIEDFSAAELKEIYELNKHYDKLLFLQEIAIARNIHQYFNCGYTHYNIAEIFQFQLYFCLQTAYTNWGQSQYIALDLAIYIINPEIVCGDDLNIFFQYELFSYYDNFNNQYVGKIVINEVPDQIFVLEVVAEQRYCYISGFSDINFIQNEVQQDRELIEEFYERELKQLQMAVKYPKHFADPVCSENFNDLELSENFNEQEE